MAARSRLATRSACRGAARDDARPPARTVGREIGSRDAMHRRRTRTRAGGGTAVIARQTVTVGDGCRIAYRFDGDAAAPILLLSNSLGTDLEMWNPQIDAWTRDRKSAV